MNELSDNEYISLESLMGCSNHDIIDQFENPELDDSIGE
jgi:hypothetical protein